MSTLSFFVSLDSDILPSTKQIMKETTIMKRLFNKAVDSKKATKGGLFKSIRNKAGKVALCASIATTCFTQTAYAATGTSAVTQPLDSLKT